MERPKFIASCSFGKDSLATILLAKEHGEPLDEAVYCEVMFDKDISGEVPEHRDFIYSTAIPTLERMGVKIIVLRSEKTYVELFTGRVTRLFSFSRKRIKWKKLICMTQTELGLEKLQRKKQR